MSKGAEMAGPFPDAENDLIEAEECFLADVVNDIAWLMDDSGITQRALAERLGISEQRISRIFSQNGRNLQARTIARIYHVLKQEPRLTCNRLDQLRADLDRRYGVTVDEWERRNSTWQNVVRLEHKSIRFRSEKTVGTDPLEPCNNQAA